MSDYDARRRYGKQATVEPQAKPKAETILFYRCPNSSCNYSWATIKGQERTICSRCGTPGRRT